MESNTFITKSLSLRNGKIVSEETANEAGDYPTKEESMRSRPMYELWHEANLLFRIMAFEQAIAEYQRLIPICPYTVYQAVIFLNIGLSRAMLGEHYRAYENFDKATEKESRLAIGWFLQGTVSYALEHFQDAINQFEECLECFEAGVDAIDYRNIGLDFLLHRGQLEHNIRLAADALARRRFGRPVEFHRLPGLTVVEPLPPPEYIEEAPADPSAPGTWYVSGRGGIRQSFRYGLDGAGSDASSSPSPPSSPAVAPPRRPPSLNPVAALEFVETEGVQSPSVYEGFPSPVRTVFARDESLDRLEGVGPAGSEARRRAMCGWWAARAEWQVRAAELVGWW
ncbi:MAG: hypothetical protein M1821_004813 [Bathelium mastoideum]|nr:MAG: hypothetical protein M1821_004813 [Bathelium mastoideum]